MRRKLGAAAVALAACASGVTGFAEAASNDKPAAESAANDGTRPIRLIAPFVSGGPKDIIARLVAQRMSGNLEQPVVDNRGGAGGAVGMQPAANAAPDLLHAGARIVRHRRGESGARSESSVAPYTQCS
jgi:tripartite-type tricarboxylate transporter receptor subunit TctC